MQTRRLNEVTIGLMTLGKIAELGRQLTLVTDQKFADNTAKKMGVKAETLQEWGNGYVAFDAVISTTGVLAILQGIRKNRKGAGRAGLVQGGTIIGYSVFYLLQTLIGLKGASSSTKLVNIVASVLHGVAGVMIFRFAQRAVN